ncbi:MAG: VPLPA-CTERM sorting domain-containing protein [Pseudomonadota bacterium]
MKLWLAAAIAATTMFAGTVQAATISVVSGDGAVIAAPGRVSNTTPADSTTIFAFNEAEGVILANDLDAVTGMSTVADPTPTSVTIGAGTAVDSHLVIFNSDAGRTQVNAMATFSFSQAILGLIIDGAGLAATNGELGAEGTSYGALDGLELGPNANSDEFEVVGNTLFLNLTVTQPGEWVRVITASPAVVPVPAAGFVLLGGLGALTLVRRRRG